MADDEIKEHFLLNNFTYYIEIKVYLFEFILDKVLVSTLRFFFLFISKNLDYSIYFERLSSIWVLPIHDALLSKFD